MTCQYVDVWLDKWWVRAVTWKVSEMRVSKEEYAVTVTDKLSHKNCNCYIIIESELTGSLLTTTAIQCSLPWRLVHMFHCRQPQSAQIFQQAPNTPLRRCVDCASDVRGASTVTNNIHTDEIRSGLTWDQCVVMLKQQAFLQCNTICNIQYAKKHFQRAQYNKNQWVSTPHRWNVGLHCKSAFGLAMTLTFDLEILFINSHSQKLFVASFIEIPPLRTETSHDRRQLLNCRTISSASWTNLTTGTLFYADRKIHNVNILQVLIKTSILINIAV